MSMGTHRAKCKVHNIPIRISWRAQYRQMRTFYYLLESTSIHFLWGSPIKRREKGGEEKEKNRRREVVDLGS